MNDGVLFAMGQNRSEVGYVWLVLKSRGAWQQIHEGVLRDVFVERQKLRDRPIKADLPLARAQVFHVRVVRDLRRQRKRQVHQQHGEIQMS